MTKKKRLPQIDEDTRQTLNKIHHHAAQNSITNLLQKGVTNGCEVLLFSIKERSATFRVNGEFIRANFMSKKDLSYKNSRRYSFSPKPRSYQEPDIAQINEQLKIKIRLHDNVKAARKKANRK